MCLKDLLDVKSIVICTTLSDGNHTFWYNMYSARIPLQYIAIYMCVYIYTELGVTSYVT